LRALRAASACLALLAALALAACEATVVEPRAPAPVVAAPPPPSVPPAPTPTPSALDPGAPVEIERLPAPGVGAAPQLTPPAPGGEATKVALLLPLSGPNAALGRALLDAATMALFEAGGDRLRLLPKDSGATPEAARVAAEQAVAEGAVLILGPIFRDAAAAAGAVAAPRGVNVVTFSTDVSVAGGNVFVFGFTPEQQVDRVAKYAASRGVLRFAALTPDNPFGAAVARALQAAATQAGGTVVRSESYPPEARGAEPIVSRLVRYDGRKAQLVERRRELTAADTPASRRDLAALVNRDALNEYDFDAILIPEGGPALRAIAPLLTYYEVDVTRVRVLGTGQWQDPALAREPALRGAWFAAPSPVAAEAFEQRFERAFGRRPPRLASLAFDSVALAAALLKAGDFGPAALRNPNGFAGVDGIFRFPPNNVAERGLAILEVGPDGFRAISEAPQTFEQRGF